MQCARLRISYVAGNLKHPRFVRSGRDPWPAGSAPVAEVPFLRHELPMPPQQRIGRNDGVEFKQGFAPYRLGLARQKSTLSVCEPDSLSSQPLLEQTDSRLGETQ